MARPHRLSIAVLIAAFLLSIVAIVPAAANNTAQTLPFSQDWTNTNLITVSDDWSGVPGIIGYRGDGMTSATGVDPQTVTADGSSTPVDVNANQTAPNTFATGGLAEFEQTDPAVALNGSGTADAPHIVIAIDTTGLGGVTVAYDLRDLDGSTDNAVSPVALQYRVGGSGAYTNVPAGFVMDATLGGSATLVTPVSAALPADAANQPLVHVRIITTDAAGPDEWVGIDNIDVTAASGDTAPAVTGTSPTDGATGVPLDASISVSFSEPVDLASSTIGLTCDSGAVAGTTSGGPTDYTFDPTSDFAQGEDCTAVVSAAGVTDVDTDDPPDTMAADYSFSFRTFEDICLTTNTTAIHDIQGNGLTSPLAGQTVTIRGVVVGDYQASTSFNGFHVQEEDADADADPATSEGIFVFEGSSPVDVAAGDVVAVTGSVVEFTSSGITLTELTDVSQVQVCTSGASVTPANVSLPFDSLTFAERFEGMLVTIDQELTVTETFTLGRFGEVVLSSGGRLQNPTNVVEPGAPAIDRQAANDRNRIVLDDGDNRQNIDPTVYPAGGLSASNTLRVGDTTPGGTFVLEERFGVYRLQPTADLPDFISSNPRPAEPPAVGGDLRVASFNVLNYFDTLDLGPDVCGPDEDQECRGADSAFELERQRAKIVDALAGLDADIVGLIELENDPGDAVEDLLAALNAATAPDTYDFIDSGTIGDDAIKVALIYKPSAVTPFGNPAILDSSVDPRFDDTLNRPALAQAFDSNDDGRFTVVVNHLKSKGSACAGDPDMGDGQGNCNVTRTMAAEALVDWLASDPTGSGDRDALVIGDLNSYAKEDPIDVFVEAGYTNLIEQFGGSDAYSFVFQGQSGYLDHALASPTLAAQVTGAADWHINADEPIALDYNTEFKSPGHVDSLYAATPYRSSDHDPVLVGLDLLHYGFDGFHKPLSPDGTTEANSGSTIPIRFTLSNASGLDVLFENPMSRTVDCETFEPIGPWEPTNATVGLTVEPPASYTYDWKTLKSWKDSCRTFELTLDDGSYWTADVHFVR